MRSGARPGRRSRSPVRPAEADTLQPSHDALPTVAAADVDPPDARGFRPLLAVRTLTVVNDNLLRWLAIGLGKHAAGAAGVALVLTIGTAGFVLPFVALAWLAGWLADRRPKPSVIAWCKFAELLIVGVAAAVLWWGHRPGGAFAGWQRLLPACAALLGVGLAGWVASLLLAHRPAADPAAPAPWNALARTWSDLRELFRSRELLAAAAGIVFFWALGAVAQLNVDQFVSEAGATSQSDSIPMLVALVVGIAVGSVVAGRISSRGADMGLVPLGALIMAIASLCLAVGSRSIFSAAGPEPVAWWTALAMLWVLGFGAGIFDVPLEAYFQATCPPPRRGALLAALNLLTFTGMLVASLLYGMLRTSPSAPGAALPTGLWLLLGTVILIGCQAALLAPALVGSIPETVPRRRLADANGLFAMVTLAATLVGMAAGNWLADQSAPQQAAAVTPLVSARGVFGIFAVLSLVAAGAAVCAAPRATLRLFVAAIVHSFCRFRVRGADLLPASGPLVLVANHLSWLDGFLLPLACPRHVRMVVYGPNIRGRFLRMLSDQWRFILFDPRPKSIGQALKAIQGGLAAGDVIGIFCEGGISRTGQLLGFKRGLEWLLERVESPLVPVSIDGMWGSVLTFAEGCYFTRWPRAALGQRGLRRPLTLTFGPTLPVGTHPDEARLALQEVAAAAVRRRMRAVFADLPGVDGAAVAAAAEAFHGACLVRRDDRLLTSLAARDPLHDSLGTQAGRLLRIRTATVDPHTAAPALADALARHRATIWLARIEQVADVAGTAEAAGLGRQLSAVVMPIGSLHDLPRARAASQAFQAATGIEPVVAFAPPEAGGIIAMNTPASRSGGDHEVTNKPDTVGRVLNGVVVWPRAAMRLRLGLPSLAAQGIADDVEGTLVIGATLPGPAAAGDAPRAAVLRERFDVDKEGFLVARD